MRNRAPKDGYNVGGAAHDRYSGLLSLVLARHRFDEIQPNTVADLLIALLWDRLASGRYRGPSLATVLRRRRRGGRRACPTNLSALDRECHTLLALCKPPLGRSSAAVV